MPYGLIDQGQYWIEKWLFGHIGTLELMNKDITEIEIKVPIIFIHKNALENIFCEVAAIVFRPQSVNLL